jgi:hypothetical protein
MARRKPTAYNPQSSRLGAMKKTQMTSKALQKPFVKAGQFAETVQAMTSRAKKQLAEATAATGRQMTEASNAAGRQVGEGVTGMFMAGERGKHKLQGGLYKSETAALKPRHWAIRILIACVILALLYFLMAGIKPFDGGFMLLICAFTVTMGAYFFFKGDVSMCGVDKVSGERGNQNRQLATNAVNRYAKLARPTANKWRKTASNATNVIKNPFLSENLT